MPRGTTGRLATRPATVQPWRVHPSPVRFALLAVPSAIALLLLWELFVVQAAGPIRLGFDTAAYWGYPRASVYPGPGEPTGLGAYRYSPVLVPLMTLWSAVPWGVFVGLWLAAMVVVYVAMAGPYALPLLVFLPVLIELGMGNVHLFLACAVVVGFRWPAAWALVLLTKVTPGIGLLWFAVRREWRSLAIALGATVALAGTSLLVAPDLWVEWMRTIAGTSETTAGNAVAVPLPIRVAAAAVLVVWGARTERRWTVVVGATLALPALWHHGLAMLIGVIALQRGWPERVSQTFDWVLLWRRAPSDPGRSDRVAASEA
jgi:hypothetical protein